MGGDFGPLVVVRAACDMIAKVPHLKLILVGQEDALNVELEQCKVQPSDRLQIMHAPEVIEMDESPSHAMRNKKNSSMRKAIELVRDQQASACVSAGNTGALMAISRYLLKMLPGVDRPAICSILPNIHGHVHVLDLGANVDVSSEQLVQFAMIGSQLVQLVEGKDKPTVGLLNIGEEEIKGNDNIKQASSLLSESSLNYIGFVEGDALYTAQIDVIVCDGFVGNVMLKASEGLSKFIQYNARQAFHQSLYSRFAGLVAMPVLRRLKQTIDPKRYNGASLLGLRGIVIKSHGGADSNAFVTAIQEAITEVSEDVPQRIAQMLEE